MSESPESPTRYFLPPEDMTPKAKKLTTRKRKTPSSEMTTQAEPGKYRFFLMRRLTCFIYRLTSNFIILFFIL